MAIQLTSNASSTRPVVRAITHHTRGRERRTRERPRRLLGNAYAQLIFLGMIYALLGFATFNSRG